jgi:hypothetical protein
VPNSGPARRKTTPPKPEKKVNIKKRVLKIRWEGERGNQDCRIRSADGMNSIRLLSLIICELYSSSRHRDHVGHLGKVDRRENSPPSFLVDP